MPNAKKKVKKSDITGFSEDDADDDEDDPDDDPDPEDGGGRASEKEPSIAHAIFSLVQMEKDGNAAIALAQEKGSEARTSELQMENENLRLKLELAREQNK
jgi:hypothetical protein